MCGICGFYKVNSSAYYGEKYLKDMNDEMILRGPDGGDIWLQEENKCGLGHRRLAIIDLSSSASQPMTNEDGNIVIAFNGEIYNHTEIRKELLELGGHKWKTDHSDTEMIIHAYEQWGIECLQKFRGMFAIALWDGKQKIFYLIRDRIGIKPLYYTIEDGVLTFASDIKAILKVRNKKAKINEKALYDYLSFLTTPCNETLFENIFKLRPATYLSFQGNGKTMQQEYWNVWDHTRPELYQADDTTISEALMQELRTAVKLRKEADVPVGVFLSGGIDSSLNAALFSENNKNKVKTFCIGYDQDYSTYKNENHYAKIMADSCGAEYYERLLTQEDLLDFIPKMVRLQGEPIADPTCVPTYYVSKLARDNGIVVTQVGEGSDELFCGYEGWKTMLRYEQINDFVFSNKIKKCGLRLLNFIGKEEQGYVEYLRRASLKQPIFWGGAEAFYKEYDKKHMISEDYRRRIGDYTSFEAIRPTYNEYKEKAWEQSHLNWMSYVDLKHRLPELLLMRVDKMSMGVSLECRVPFLDHKFVEMAMSISQAKKTENKNSKIVLKKAVRGIIPDLLIDRKKQGFGVPIYDWFFDKLGNAMRKEILYFVEQTGLWNVSYITEIINSPDYAPQVWYLYNLSLWWKEYIA